MKKLIGEIMGCVAVYYVINVLIAVNVAYVWGDLVKYGRMQAAHEMDDAFHKRHCKRQQKVFDYSKGVLFEEMKKESN